ncbi:MAG TPA: type VI secretion system tip protein TssI/VgrG [Bryobacteraceae bacterium]|jgi:type VI secretion system secreted protein VgrG|nr:type VI secretion system tip protein TssI/VgrG [Bryobacteraceae bacterium]
MPYQDDQRPIQLTTSLGQYVLLAQNVRGREAVSELFRFQIDAATEQANPIQFDSLLGTTVTIAMQGKQGGLRYLNGLVIGLTQGSREELFTYYRIEVAPNLWKLTRNSQSRIFQQKSVTDILKVVFTGQDVDYSGLTGTYPAREYCVQYRETDFNFASRLMEEEGIFYFFKHTSSGHTLMLGDNPQAFTNIPFQPDVTYETGAGGGLNEDRIMAWEKAQDLRSGKSTLWDYTFEMPDKHCETTQQVQDTVQAGTVSHKLSVGGNSSWELYDYPGGYVKPFDGIDKSGGEQASSLNTIFTNNDRIMNIRMQAETVGAMTISGESLHPGFTPGYKFNLKSHYSDNGEFTLLEINHDAHQPLGSDTQPYRYTNTFQAIPAALPYRPQRVTPEPTVSGPQTAIVVGTAGEEIFTDKYGRIKVQFPWDRQGAKDANSSCWLRVATYWAGTQWGSVHIPRIGQEVIVGFLEGDPDQPIVVGSVYNANNMPPYTLPDNKTQSGIKSRSSKAGAAANYNEIFFEDKMGSEILRIHAEKDQFHEVENDDTQTVGHDRMTTIDHDETREVKNNRTTTIDVDETKTVKGKETITITGNQTLEIQQGNQSNTIDMGNQSTVLKMGNQSTEMNMGNQSTKCDLGQISMEAMQQITLTVGASKITIDQMGVTIEGMMIKVNAQIQLAESALMIQSSASAMMQIQGGITMIN